MNYMSVPIGKCIYFIQIYNAKHVTRVYDKLFLIKIYIRYWTNKDRLIQVKFPYSTSQHQSTYITLMIGKYIRFIQNDCENVDPEFSNDVDNGCRKGEHLKSRIMGMKTCFCLNICENKGDAAQMISAFVFCHRYMKYNPSTC